MKTDILVIGSGISGLFFAIQIAEKRPEWSITILTKSKIDNSNTWYAQGGIAVVSNKADDSFEKHIEDTLKSGGGLSDINIVKLVVETAPDRLKELVDYGVHFTLTDNGDFDLALEGGHSTSRVVHAFDNTGEHLIKALIPKAKSFPNIHFYEDRFCIELVKNTEGNILGVHTLNIKEQTIESFAAKAVILATGGSGQVYKNTTNPEVATGDGLAMGINIGGNVSNLNFVQFHPSALFEKNTAQLFLLTEAIRGSRGHIVNKKQERFVFQYDSRGELATRDIVSMAIFSELKKSGEECVYLDCRHLPDGKFDKEFPEIKKKLLSKNINPSKDLIPIIPAAHYQCGGLKVNAFGQTNINGLFAIGECAETGLHGVNRLASNSLLEGLVFAHQTAKFISENLDVNTPIAELVMPDFVVHENDTDSLKQIITDIKETMSRYGTIAAEPDDLKEAQSRLEKIETRLSNHRNGNQVSEHGLIANNILTNAKAIIRYKLKYLKEQKELNH